MLLRGHHTGGKTVSRGFFDDYFVIDVSICF
jgi:hypothetical protein